MNITPLFISVTLKFVNSSSKTVVLLSNVVGISISPLKEVIIVCYPDEEEEVISRLARVGFEKIKGYTYALDAWKLDNENIDAIESISPANVIYNNNKIKFLDVRKVDELKLGSVPNAIHIPLSELNDRLDSIDKSEDYLIYCAGGYRSMIACSILKSKGYNSIKNIYGGFNAISEIIK